MDKLSTFKIGDREKTVGKVIGYGIILALLGAAAYYILPIINVILENVLYWGLLSVAVIVMALILSNKKFWLGVELFGSAIGRWTLGAVIEMDPWNVLYMKVETAQKDREILHKEIKKLRGQEDILESQLSENNEAMRLAAGKVDILKRKMTQNPNDTSTNLQLQKVTNDYQMAKEFIDNVAPIKNDITKLVDLASQAYDKSGIEIEIAKNTITQKKALYNAVTTGSSAMSRAMRAFAGRPELNNAADKALEVLRLDIGNKIGSIKESIKITSQFMDDRNLTDAAKAQNAVESMKQLNDNMSVPYSNTVTAERIQVKTTDKNNKYMDFLNK